MSDSCCASHAPDPTTESCCTSPAKSCSCQSAPHEAIKLPIAIIGAGPIGLSAAIQLLEKGESPIVLEAGAEPGSNIREWRHVKLFSPWKYLVDPVSRRMLEATGWSSPDDDVLPTGGELIDTLIEPLAALPALTSQIRLNHRVIAITRRGFDKVKSGGRDDAPFELQVRTPDGRMSRILARAVIDASGTWQSPNPMGGGGIPAHGEAELAGMIAYRIPDATGADRERYAGKRVLVVGSGHSAFNALLDLAALADSAPDTRISWAIRRYETGRMFGGEEKDALEARGALGARLRSLVESDKVHLEAGVRISSVARSSEGATIETDDGRNIGPFDEIVVATGFRPDLTLARELRVKLDPWLEAPEQLAPLIDPNMHSCGTVYPHGAAELAHPEKNFYVAGMKSYGRAPTFLLLTGYEQVRSIACALTGDEKGARNVELVLPETGVCHTELGSSCCSTPAEVTTLTSRRVTSAAA